MFTTSSKRALATCLRISPIFLALSWVMIGTSVQAQSTVAEIIAPVGEVCLASEPCVGQPADGGVRDQVPPGGRQANNRNSNTDTGQQATPASSGASPPSGGNEPQTAAALSNEFDPAAAYQMSCMACHTTGAAGAPMIGNQEVWDARLEKGMDALMENVINGINAMPAKGLCMTCSNEELRAIVDHMISQ